MENNTNKPNPSNQPTKPTQEKKPYTPRPASTRPPRPATPVAPKKTGDPEAPKQTQKPKYNNNNRRSHPVLKDDIKIMHNDYVAPFLADSQKREDSDELSLPDTTYMDSSIPDELTGAVVGRNAVRELLKSNRAIDKIFIRKGDREGSIVVIVAEAINRNIPIIEVEKGKLDTLSGFVPHQGVVAMAAEKEYVEVEDILKIAEERGETPLLVIADGIVDPYNLGALIRTAEGTGAHGLIIPKRRAVGLTPMVSKASAGAVEHLAIAKVSNIAVTIEWLKKKGIWTFAAEAGGIPYYEGDFKCPAAIIFGSEGDGISRLIKEKCDFIISIPMYGKVNSFNVSTAASVILCEAARQQKRK